MSRKPKITKQELRFWELFEVFKEHLEPILEQPEYADKGLDKAHPRRKLDSSQYLTLWLMAMFNPVVDSLRGLCQASQLDAVKQKCGAEPVSLGSFSEAQNVLDLSILPQVVASLMADLPEHARNFDPRFPEKLTLLDSSIWPALQRMGWASWRHQHTKQNAVRLHVEFHLLKDQAEVIQVTEGRSCERAYLRENLRRGQFYVADRNYCRDHSLLNKMLDGGCHFIIRGRESITPSEVLQEYPLSGEDKDAGVISDQLVCLGKRSKDKTQPLRRIEVRMDSGEILVLLTDQSPEELPAHMVGAIYHARWSIELYFKWIKSILKNRHFLAESPQGVAIQMYMALIAAILLQSITGKRPSKRQMELIQFFLMGWIDKQELLMHLEKLLRQQEARRNERSRKNP